MNTIEDKLREIARNYIRVYIKSLHPEAKPAIAESTLFYELMFDYLKRETEYEQITLNAYIRQHCISDINFYVDQQAEVLRDKLKIDFGILL